MNLTIEIPEEKVVRFQREAQARGLTVDRWLIELGDRNAPDTAPRASSRTYLEACSMVRGFADDVDFSRDPSPARDIVL